MIDNAILLQAKNLRVAEFYFYYFFFSFHRIVKYMYVCITVLVFARRYFIVMSVHRFWFYLYFCWSALSLNCFSRTLPGQIKICPTCVLYDTVDYLYSKSIFVFNNFQNIIFGIFRLSFVNLISFRNWYLPKCEYASLDKGWTLRIQSSVSITFFLGV